MGFSVRKEIYIFTVVFFLGQMVLTSQTTEEKIIKITTDYFELARENFHLQFNKTTYLAGETIWSKGFVLDKKTNFPSAETTNVYLDFLNLEAMTMDELDEIYTSTTVMMTSLRNNIGIIKMYRSKLSNKKTFRIAPYSVNYGFEEYKHFKNNLYISTDDEGFKNFGVINWIPKITNENNVFFNFKIPDMKQKTVKILIEGMSKSGEFISTVKEIQLE